MANFRFDFSGEFFAGGGNWLTDTFVVVLLDLTLYTAVRSDKFLSAIPSGARVKTSNPLTGKAATNGFLSAAPALFNAFSGATCGGFVIVNDTGSAATSPLIEYVDTDAVNLPLIPTGGGVLIRWDAQGITQL